MKSFFSKLNIRQLIIHFAAFWFFIYAFDTLGSLYDYKFQYQSQLYLVSALAQQRYNTDILILNEVGSAGLIIAYIISWQISVRRNWFWFNSVLIFLVAFFLKSHNYLGWDHLQSIFLAPGTIFTENTLPCIITNGIVMLAIGCFLLFKKQIIDFIDRGVSLADKKERVKATKAAVAEKNK